MFSYLSYLRPIKKILSLYGKEGREKPCNWEGGERGEGEKQPKGREDSEEGHQHGNRPLLTRVRR